MGLSAVMLPYLLLICIAAQLSTMLYAARHFTVPACAPRVLNVVWLVAAWLVAPWFARQPGGPGLRAGGRGDRGGNLAGRWRNCRRSAGWDSTSTTTGRPPARGCADHPQHGADGPRPGRHANQRLHWQPDRLGTDRRGRTGRSPSPGSAACRYPMQQGAVAAISLRRRSFTNSRWASSAPRSRLPSSRC